MKKAVIGIVGKPSVETDMWHYVTIVDEIRYVLLQNGALPIGILPTDRKLNFKYDEELDYYYLSSREKLDLETIIKRCDGIILEGGLVSNQYEEDIVNICILYDIPILGICSGFNNMVRALKGTIYVDYSIFHNQFGTKIAHEVEIIKDSKLFQILKQDKIVVNSIHTCIAKEEDIKGYKIVAKCLVDQTVEAIELEGKRFVMGIKWHPELMDSMNAIFQEFINECGKSVVLKK